MSEQSKTWKIVWTNREREMLKFVILLTRPSHQIGKETEEKTEGKNDFFERLRVSQRKPVCTFNFLSLLRRQI